MPRFYFHLESRYGARRDDEGVETDAADRAIREARAAIEEMRRSADLAGLSGAWTLVMRNEQDAELRRIAV